MLSERVKLGLLCFLLLLMLGLLAFSAVNTIQAAQSFQQQFGASRTGGVSAIRPWMTVHMISHIYHVPEGYLYRSLNMNSSAPLRHVTLYEIANRKRQRVDQVVHILQYAILAYRKEHSRFLTPTPTRHTNTKPPSPKQRRTKY